MSETAPKSSRLLLYALGVSLAAAVAAMLLLRLRLLPRGVPGQWEWPWRPPDFACAPLSLLVIVVYALLVLFLIQLQARPALKRRHAAAFVASACVTVALALLLFESDEPVPPLHLSASTASVPATGYLAYATAIEGVGPLFRGLSGDENLVNGMPARVRTHPPGPVLYYYLGLRLLDRFPGVVNALERHLQSRYGLTTDMMYAYTRGYLIGTVKPRHLSEGLILGLTLALLGCLAPLPAYFAGTALGGRREGLLAAFCTALVPSLLIFIPSIDGWAAVLALATVAAGLWAVRRQSVPLYALTGLLMAAAVFWSIGLGACAVCLAAVLLPRLSRPDTRGRALAGLVAALGVLIALYALLYLLGGYSLLGNVRLMVAAQKVQMDIAYRDYRSWVGMNPYDVVLFMGPMLAALALAAFSCWRQADSLWRGYLVGVCLTFGLVWLSGSTLGEVGRIWLFLMVLLAVMPALPLARLPHPTQKRALALLALGQIALAFSLHCNLTLVHP